MPTPVGTARRVNPTMQIHLARNGQMLGPQDAEAVPTLLQNGTVLPSDFYWHDGMADWAAVHTKWPDGPPALPVPPPLATPVAAAAEPAAFDLAAIAQASPAVIRGARWFWWIAGLSLVNTIMLHTGSDTGFAIGLGFTLVADTVFQGMKLIAFAIDAVAIGFFFGAGWFGRQGRFWAFVLGSVAYACDALIYVIGHDWLSVAFHGLALVFILNGARELRAGVREARQSA